MPFLDVTVFLDFTVVELLAIVAVTAGGAIVQGSAGIGLGLVAGPVLLSMDARFAPGPLLLAGVVVGSRHLRVEWQHLARPSVGRALVGLPIGAAGAVIVLDLMAPETLSLWIGFAIIAASLALLGGLTLRRSPVTDTATGAACAFTSMTAALPGPPLVVGFHDLTPPAMRCTVSFFVACVSGVAAIVLAAVGRFGAHELGLLALLAPSAAVGVVASRWTRPWLDRTWFRPAVLLISAAGGAVLVFRSL